MIRTRSTLQRQHMSEMSSISGSNEYPMPPWPISSRAARLIQARTSMSVLSECVGTRLDMACMSYGTAKRYTTGQQTNKAGADEDAASHTLSVTW